MKNIAPRVIVLLLLLSGVITTRAQQLEWSIDFNTVFDNREGDHLYTPTKTFFQTQLAPEIGISLLDGQHNLMGGVVWTQPIGEEWHGKRLSPTLYYRYKGPKGLSMELGMFPRNLMHRELPEYIWNDSVRYTQHNIRGFMATYVGTDGFFEAILDWRGMQSEKQREAFNIFAQGEWQRPNGLLLAGGVAMMNHYALSKNPVVEEHIVDNFIVNPYVGVDLSHRTPLDSLTIRIGALGSITRNREFGNWKTPVGARLDIALRWRWLGWNNITYAGGKLFPYYTEFGASLDQGEPYYQTKWYNRTSVLGTIFDNQFVNLRASLDFNFAPHNFTFYQRLILRVCIDSNYKRLPKDYRLPPAFY